MAVKIREKNGEWWLFVAALALVLFLPIASADMVKCQKADGGIYVGPTPPEGCSPVGSIRSGGASGGASWKPGEFLPTPTPAPSADEVARAAAEEQHKKVIEARRMEPAVAMQNMVNKRYSNGRQVEGTVANGASFPVYNVKICFFGNDCQHVAPPTLQPGAQGTFSYPMPNAEFPPWKVTWDVEPGGE